MLTECTRDASGPLLRIDGATVAKGGHRLLNNLSLEIAEGQHTAILGPNGSGKSSLINLLTRRHYPLARPDGGGIYATLGIGYGDGWPRRFSNCGHVLLHGRRAPIRGRICMDQLVVDVSRIPNVRPGDIATLIGTDGPETITAAGLAAALETTPHEITTCLTARLPRILVH